MVRATTTQEASSPTRSRKRDRSHNAAIVERMAIITGSWSARDIGERTSTNHETVRRYISGISGITAEFLVRYCEAFDVSSEWLLRGRGPIRGWEVEGHVLAGASLGALHRAIAEVHDKAQRPPTGGGG